MIIIITNTQSAINQGQKEPTEKAYSDNKRIKSTLILINIQTKLKYYHDEDKLCCHVMNFCSLPSLLDRTKGAMKTKLMFALVRCDDRPRLPRRMGEPTNVER